MRPAEHIERQIHHSRKQREIEYQAELAEWRNGQQGEERTRPVPNPVTTQLTIDDATMEATVRVHDRNPRGLMLVTDELAGWLRSFNLYRGGQGRDVQQWLSIYNGGTLQINRRTDNEVLFLPSTAISVCGTIQPKVAADTLYSDEFLANGFSARMLAVQPPARVMRWSDRDVSEATERAMFELAERLFRLEGNPIDEGLPQPVPLRLTNDAQIAFQQFYDAAAAYAENLEEPLRSMWLKLRPVAARFALIFSIVNQLEDDPDGGALRPIRLTDLQSGVRLAWWFGNEITRNYDSRALTDDGNDLENHLVWIHRKSPTGITARQLQQGRRTARPTEYAEHILNKLAEAGHGVLRGKTFVPNPLAG